VGTRSALVAVLSHFPELEPELELLGSVWDADLSDDGGGGCPLAFGECGLRLTSIAHPLIIGP
jgi:hypothetical protein